MPYDDIVRIMKEVMVDNGLSTEVPMSSNRSGNFERDKINSLESKISKLEGSLQRKTNTNQGPQQQQRPKVDGKEICHRI